MGTALWVILAAAGPLYCAASVYYVLHLRSKLRRASAEVELYRYVSQHRHLLLEAQQSLIEQMLSELGKAIDVAESSANGGRDIN